MKLIRAFLLLALTLPGFCMADTAAPQEKPSAPVVLVGCVMKVTEGGLLLNCIRSGEGDARGLQGDRVYGKVLLTGYGKDAAVGDILRLNALKIGPTKVGDLKTDSYAPADAVAVAASPSETSAAPANWRDQVKQQIADAKKALQDIKDRRAKWEQTRPTGASVDVPSDIGDQAVKNLENEISRLEAQLT